MLSNALIEDTAFRLMARAAIEIPEDYLDGIKAITAREEGGYRSLRPLDREAVRHCFRPR